jgi:predicted phosphodiesterase
VSMNPYSVETASGVLTVKFLDVAAGWEQWLLLRSDVHHDSTLCDRELELDHLNKAKARDALIIDGGDLFDAMQSRNDRRRSYEEIRPEYLTNDYYGALVKNTAEEYAPYAANFLVLARGNHETAVLLHGNTDLSSQLAYKLSESGGAPKVGGYEGWIRFTFHIQQTVRQTVRLRYFHGAGGGAAVTKGVIDTNRQAVYLPDADIVLNGHNHQAYLLPVARERLSQAGKVYKDLVWFVRTPGYKHRGGWEREKGHAPAPHGAAWLRFYLDATSSMVKHEIVMDLR